MSLKLKLILSFSFIIGITVLLGVVLISSSWILRSRYMVYIRERQSFEVLNELVQSFEKQRRALDGYMVALGPNDQYKNFETEIEELLAQWRKSALYAVEKKEYEKFEQLLKSFWSEVNKIFELVESGRRNEAVQMMDASTFFLGDRIEKELKYFAREKKTHSDQTLQFAKKLAGRTTAFSIGLLVSVILVGIGLSVVLFQSIARPIEKLREGAKKIGKGEWNFKLDVTNPPELEELARSFEEMAKSLKDLEVKVVQMDRMSSIGTLAGGVAHEINNPLTGVLGQAQLLMSILPASDPNRSKVEKIERAAQRCRKIVKGLLNFARPTEHVFQPVDVNDIVADVLSLSDSDMAALKIKVGWEADPLTAKIWASANHIQQVFLNIVTNAMHAMPTGGTLTIRAKNVPGDPPFVEVSFIDTGTGIAPDHLSHLFDPFFTTKEVGKGTGLGLTISYGIIKEHKGQIIAKSEGLGKGAAIMVQIPMAVNGDQGGSGQETEKAAPVPRFET